MFNGRRQPSRGGTSRMMREYQVRICERLGVKFPGPTRQSRPVLGVTGEVPAALCGHSSRRFSIASLHLARFTAIPSYLLPVPAPRKIPHAHSGPPELGHYSSQTPKHARSPIALWDLEQIQECLRADTLQPIKIIDLAAHTLKPELPRINGFCRGNFRCFFSRPLPKGQRPHNPSAWKS